MDEESSIGIGVAILQQTTGDAPIMFYGSQILTKSEVSLMLH